MGKRIFSLILIFVLCFSCFSVTAYEPSGFDINAKTALLVSLDTDEVIYSKNADAKVYPASITKIMTTLLILESEKFNPEEKITMTKEVLRMISGTGSVVSNLKEGEEITQLDLVYFVLMVSAGDCAYLAAIHYYGSVDAFVDRMNERAVELGLKNTHYVNPIGLHDDDHYTTAEDTYVLTKLALKNKLFKQICESDRYNLPATNMQGQRRLSTTNFLQDKNTNYYYAYAKGVKTGFTDEAGRCLVSTASYNGYNYMCILFGCTPNNTKRHEFVNSKDLYRWAFNNFEFKNIANTDNPICEIGVNLSFDADYVPLYVEKSFVSVLPKDADESTITIVPKLNAESVDAPVKKGQKLGTADVIYAEKVIGTVDLVAGSDVNKSTILTILEALKGFFTSSYMILLYIIIAIAILIFIIAVIRLNTKRSKKRKVKYIPYDKRKENKNDKYY